MPYLEPNEAIVSFDSQFGSRDYFKVKIKHDIENSIYRTRQYNIDLNKWMPVIKNVLQIDRSGETFTGYCMPGTSFEKEWRSLFGVTNHLYKSLWTADKGNWYRKYSLYRSVITRRINKQKNIFPEFVDSLESVRSFTRHTNL